MGRGLNLLRWGLPGLAVVLILLGSSPAWVEEKATPKNDKVWWSLRPIVKPSLPPPSPDQPNWNANPIDRFILTRLREMGFSPSPPADRRTLLRRLKFDLVGLPPTPEELDAFLADQAPNAYEKLVDRFLASPHRGERWARHWLDVVHFAETHGHDQDVPRDHAWPYRDYLIQAFNSDKPYTRFIQEQIAGDILFPNDPKIIPALGFLAAGPWDESSLQSIREDSIDRKAGQYLDRDDMITTVGLSFLSTTIQCARCHDHKFDPIGIDEYYGLQAVFAGVDRANRTYEADPKIAHRRQTLQQQIAYLKNQGSNTWVKDPNVMAQVAAFAKAQADIAKSWTVLVPFRHASAQGATLTLLPDGSVYCDGKRPAKDAYTFEADTDLAKVAALRLEVLMDPRLPHGGPGRQDNGNLHLSEIKVEVAPVKSPEARRTVPLAKAVADFNQDGWEISRAIDGKMETAWGIYPAVGQSHQAIFFFKEPVEQAGGLRFTITLEQQHGGGHLIGRPRLAVSGAAQADSLLLPPPPIQAILAKPAPQRTEADLVNLARHVLTIQAQSELAALPSPQLVYAAAAQFTADGSFKPANGCRPIHILKRGDIRRPGKEAKPGALECVESLEHRFQLADPNNEGLRRAALARWISDSKNPLTWRSIVNRVWQHHFGRGLVATANDFGKMGARPTHPELLDWLTWQFQEDGGSLKKLHRLIVTSAVYRQSSRQNPELAKVDADNAYLGRMNRTRLDAESVRDAVLVVAGKLDPKMGGPSIKHFKQTPGIHRTPKIDYEAFDPDSPGGHRRSIYRFIFRTLPDPFMDALDCPDASQFVDRRAESVTPLQALAMLNDPFIVRMSEHFAKRVEKETTMANRIQQAYRLALGREANQREVRMLSLHAERHGLASACRVLLNCNEFMFVP